MYNVQFTMHHPVVGAHLRGATNSGIYVAALTGRQGMGCCRYPGCCPGLGVAGLSARPLPPHACGFSLECAFHGNAPPTLAHRSSLRVFFPSLGGGIWVGVPFSLECALVASAPPTLAPSILRSSLFVLHLELLYSITFITL